MRSVRVAKLEAACPRLAGSSSQACCSLSAVLWWSILWLPRCATLCFSVGGPSVWSVIVWNYHQPDHVLHIDSGRGVFGFWNVMMPFQQRHKCCMKGMFPKKDSSSRDNMIEILKPRQCHVMHALLPST